MFNVIKKTIPEDEYYRMNGQQSMARDQGQYGNSSQPEQPPQQYPQYQQYQLVEDASLSVSDEEYSSKKKKPGKKTKVCCHKMI